jgi:hypothetical protein
MIFHGARQQTKCASFFRSRRMDSLYGTFYWDILLQSGYRVRWNNHVASLYRWDRILHFKGDR